ESGQFGDPGVARPVSPEYRERVLADPGAPVQPGPVEGAGHHPLLLAVLEHHANRFRHARHHRTIAGPPGRSVGQELKAGWLAAGWVVWPGWWRGEVPWVPARPIAGTSMALPGPPGAHRWDIHGALAPSLGHRRACRGESLAGQHRDSSFGN